MTAITPPGANGGDLRFIVFLLVTEVAFIVGFAKCGEYGPTATPQRNGTHVESDFDHLYPAFQDIHMMVFIGFGFLMTFLKKYGYFAVSINMLLAAYAAQWHLLLYGLLHLDENGKFSIGLTEVVHSEFAAASVLISFGAVLGIGSPFQYVVMVFVEMGVYTANEYVFGKLIVNDVGGSMCLHMFGAYFGIAVAQTWYNPDACHNENEKSVYHSDLFSMIGSIILFLFWPSFNACLVTPDDARMRTVLNTYCSMTSCAVVAFAMSSLVDKRRRFDMIHIQNVTLAGGVAIGTAANLIVTVAGSMTVGAVAAIVSTFGYAYLQPFLEQHFYLHETCGVNNLHGITGILAGIISIVVCLFADEENYKSTLYDIFPAMNPSLAVRSEIEFLPDRSPTDQAVVQAIGLGVSLAMAIVGGTLTGLLLKLPVFRPLKGPASHFSDEPYFILPDEEDIEKADTSIIDQLSSSTLKFEQPQSMNVHESVWPIY